MDSKFTDIIDEEIRKELEKLQALGITQDTITMLQLVTLVRILLDHEIITPGEWGQQQIKVLAGARENIERAARMARIMS